MAVLDSDANEIVIRVVYDGPPEAGKTTSLRALASSLEQPSVTPEEDADGHTQWFDWMEYTGGRFAGCRIRCQIVSVPGQAALFRRSCSMQTGSWRTLRARFPAASTPSGRRRARPCTSG